MFYKAARRFHAEALGDMARGLVFRSDLGDHPFRPQTLKGIGEGGPRPLRSVAQAPALFI